MTISEFVTATENMGDKEKKGMEAYCRHEAFLAGMRMRKVPSPREP